MASLPKTDVSVAVRCPLCASRQIMGVASLFTATVADEILRADWMWTPVDRRRGETSAAGFTFLGATGADVPAIQMRCRRRHKSKPILAPWLIKQAMQHHADGRDSFVIPRRMMTQT